MLTRVLTLASLAALAACSSGGKLPIYGDWRITSYHAENTGPVPIGVLAWVGTSASMSGGELRLGVDRCSNPVYAPHPFTPAEFTQQYHVDPGSLGLTANPIEAYDLACGTGDARRAWILFVKSADTLLVPREGTFYEMSRREVGM